MTSTRTQPIAVTTGPNTLDRVHRVLLLTQLIVTGVAVIALVTLNALDVAPIVVMVVVGALICAGCLPARRPLPPPARGARHRRQRHRVLRQRTPPPGQPAAVRTRGRGFFARPPPPPRRCPVTGRVI